MGRRYDDDDKPRGEWRFLRFLGGMVLGGIVSLAVLTWMAVTLPRPGGGVTDSGAEDRVTETAAADDGAAGETGGDTSLAALPNPVPQPPGNAAPAPAPEVTAPGQPAPQEGAEAPETFGQTDSAIEGDFGASDETIAARSPGSVQAPEVPQPPASAGQGTVLQLEGPAIQINAAPFEAPVAGEPLMAVILTDAGASTLSNETLLSLSVPLTLAIVPRNSEDARLAAEAKLAGYEVLAELPVADDADSGILTTSMSDVEVADKVEMSLTELWMSIGAMPRTTGDVEVTEALARAMIGVLERHGFAFVNAAANPESEARTFAEAFGVPHTGPDTIIDGEASATDAYAALDEAAETAASSGRAVVRGPASRPMLEGLLRWWLEKNGRDARIAPLSAVCVGGVGAAAAGGI